MKTVYICPNSLEGTFNSVSEILEKIFGTDTPTKEQVNEFIKDKFMPDALQIIEVKLSNDEKINFSLVDEEFGKSYYFWSISKKVEPIITSKFSPIDWEDFV